ncbi:MAG TPA: GSU2403 family nucleotidyltransferase fold protein [Thermoanaerobaculia bacterium]
MIERFSESTQTLYAELLDQCLAAEGEEASGSYVSKQINGATYWYHQQSFGSGRKQQTYLGRETPDLLETIARRREARADEKRRRELIDMLAAGGMLREQAAVGQVVRTLAEAGVFRTGGVLVGTLAFGCYANMLGVRFEQQSLRTADVDIAHDPSIALAMTREPELDLLERLRQVEPRFFAVPGLDPREPSTSMKVRGRDLRIDFVTTTRRGRSSRAAPIPLLGIAATPLRGIDYLIGETTRAVVLAGSGIVVNIPTPGRFALHKLWLARERNVSEQAKARKDLRQAEQLIEVLESDRPEELTRASSALVGGMRRVAESALRRLRQ